MVISTTTLTYIHRPNLILIQNESLIIDTSLYYHIMDTSLGHEYIHSCYNQRVVPALCAYMRIDNQSRAFDPEWRTNGKLLQAAHLIVDWIHSEEVKGLKSEVIHDPDHAPLIWTEFEGSLPYTLLFYCHYDKQPPMEGWREGLAAYTPVIEEGKLYGRGGADDGYAIFSTVLALKALIVQNVALPRCIIITEGDEESVSEHMPYYLETLKERIGVPTHVFCLDSGALDYDRLWLTNSLRGNLLATLRVDILQIGLHSGDTSGVVPNCFRVARTLLSRIENSESGDIHQAFHVNVPPKRYEENVELSRVIGKAVYEEFSFLPGVQPLQKDPLRSLINRNWKPSFTVIGQSGFPEAQGSGNAMHPWIQIRFTLRLPPTLSSQEAVESLKRILTSNVPYNAKVELKNIRCSEGWNTNNFEPYFQKAVDDASELFFKQKKLCLGQGGSIPLLSTFQKLWPNTPFLVTGVLGPKSNAHGPNEFLHIDYAKKLTCCLSYIVGKIAEHRKE